MVKESRLICQHNTRQSKCGAIETFPDEPANGIQYTDT
jgi:hypothetical protein